jgi:nucleotide-binding universal stress UspA family protein
VNKKSQKMIVIPVDGSDNALKSLDYLDLVFGPKHNLNVTVFYVLPRLPPILVEESMKNSETRKKLAELESRNTKIAERFLKAAKDRLIEMGFAEKSVAAFFQKMEVGIARDIVNWSEKHRADAVVLSTRGRSRLEVVFMGEVAAKVLEYSRVCPVWMVKGRVVKKRVLLAVDNSENAMRAADHAGFMLSNTDVNVTIFHSKRDLRRYVPKTVLDDFPEIQKFWRRKAGETISPFMQKAKEMLLSAGLKEAQIALKNVDGSRSAAADILKEARNSDSGGIFLGLHGYSGVKDFTMGSVTRKVLNQASDMAVCIVP